MKNWFLWILAFLTLAGSLVSSSLPTFRWLWHGPTAVVQWHGLPTASRVEAPSTPLVAPEWIGYYRKAGEWVFRILVGDQILTLKSQQPQQEWEISQVALLRGRPVQITLTNQQTWTLKLHSR